MSGFYVKKITAKGAGKIDSSIDFCPKLNIIEGLSDSGKSCVAQCIDFIFGGTDDSPFSESSKYNVVEGVLSTENGDVCITRVVGKNQVEVNSAINGIESGTYDIQYKSKNGNKHPVLNELILKLIGIDELPMVPSDMNFRKKRLTWKNLLGMLYIDEDHITSKNSVVLPDQATANTLFLSCLLYLITGKDFSEQDAKEKDEIKKAKRTAIRDFVNEKLTEISNQKLDVDEKLSEMDNEDVDIDARIKEITEEISSKEKRITEAINNSREILGEILLEEEKLTSSQVLSERYKYLRTQYDADIKRLTFIVDGEDKIKSVTPNTTCPFCESKIQPKKNVSYIKAAQAELSRIVSQINGLTEAENDAKDEQKDILEKIKELKASRTNIENLIAEELKPRVERLSILLAAYKGRLWLSQQQELLSKNISDFTKDLVKLDTEEAKVKKLEYHPRECFPADFSKVMTDYANEMLKECKYENLAKASFDMSTFDLKVNGDDKKTHGKGYRAYLNTVLVLMFRRYLYEHAKYNPSFFMIDTPLHGFDEGVEEAAPESMRTALFNYILSSQDSGQLIVIENMDHIPNIDYESNGANLITFTKGKIPGRYGFLADVK